MPSLLALYKSGHLRPISRLDNSPCRYYNRAVLRQAAVVAAI